MNEEIKIIDESEDRKYFTILPNYITNHSSAIDQALYFQMKRLAGEKGICFATQQTLIEQLSKGSEKISYHKFKKSLNYLLKNKWIEFIGTISGKTRPVNSYKIKNIWTENNKFYDKKILSPQKISFEKQKDTFSTEDMILSPEKIEEEPIIKKNITIAEQSSALSQNIDLNEEIKKLEDSPRRDLNVIAFYAEQKQPDIQTKGQLQVFIRRHLRAAKEVKEFSDEQIIAAAKRCRNDYPNINWTIDTIKKILTK